MNIQENLLTIKKKIATAAFNAERKTDSVKLLGVTKKQPLKAIHDAYLAGLCDFGENYLQEAQPKIKALSNYPIQWHFIGPIQSNKAKDIARLFSWVHSVDRIKVAKLLHAGRQEHQDPLNICIQVNIDNEPSKSGVSIESLHELIDAILPLDKLRLCGLMTMPQQKNYEQNQKESFVRLRNLLVSTNNQYNLNLETLSMGTSQDYQSAISAGSTIIRVGQALFGKRL